MAVKDEAATTEVATTDAPQGRWRVKSSFPLDNRKVLFTSFSEKRARRFIQNRYPRGSEAYLESPDGTTEAYENERADDYGIETEPWGPFDPDSWVPPAEQTPPGQTAWGDEGG